MIDLKRKVEKKLREDVMNAYESRLASITHKEFEYIQSHISNHLDCIKNSNQTWTRELYIHLKVMYAQVLLEKKSFSDFDIDLMKICVALQYFVDHEDIIPDYVVGDGFLDDAILTNLVLSKVSRGRRAKIERMLDVAIKGMSS